MKPFLQALLLCLILGTASVRAQLSCGLKAGVGLSQITGYARGSASTFRVIPSPSAALGFYGQLEIGKHWLLRSELLGSHVTDQYELVMTITDPFGVPTGGHGIVRIWRNVSYLSLPIFWGVRIHRMDVFLGMQASLALRSSGKDRGLFPGFGEPVEINNRYPSPIFRPLDAGPKAAIQWHISERFSIEGSYYHGLMAIQESPNFPWPMRVRQLLVGMQWRIAEKQRLL